MDDLQQAVARNLGAREVEAAEARVLVRQEVERFERWLASLDVLPTISALRRRGDEHRGPGAPRERARAGSRSHPPTASGSRRMARAVVSRHAPRPHGAPEGQRRRGTTRTATCTRCASCSRSTLELAEHRVEDRRAPRSRRSRRGAARAPGDPPRHARQRAGAGAGPAGGGRGSRDEVELVPITTSGGPTSAARPPLEDKSRFVKEIEEALLAGEVDLAVHSAKDVPAELPDGLAIVGVPERADPRDALCGAPTRSTGCARARWWAPRSLRRRSQLLARRPDLDVRDLRGNVDTRLRRARRRRLRRRGARRGRARPARARGRGRTAVATEQLLPAAGQGCLALEARAGDASRGRARRGAHRPRGALVRCSRSAPRGRRARRRLPHARGRPRDVSGDDGSSWPPTWACPTARHWIRDVLAG